MCRNTMGLVGPDLQARAVIDSGWGTHGCGVDESGADIASLLVPHYGTLHWNGPIRTQRETRSPLLMGALKGK